MADAARSFHITVQNLIGREWTRTKFGLGGGIWSDNGSAVPPEKIPPARLDNDGDLAPGMIKFESESNGFATGTEGTTSYTSNKGNITISWDNPFAGANGFGVAVPAGYVAEHTPIGGNNAYVTVTIRKA